ncbi:hypothetical protein EW026_g7524 [Hermanssonia centrifuga]|uniref:Uncharacterized protein n=1 Tax=Hermanssonia centrifuga TaxID=98765 RepID=A0A4S4K7L4_9APHY|nr:hypothetical protein EW026_g7524 [Hermanssonia centrifuga]
MHVKTLAHIEDQLGRLHERAGVEVLLVAVRGNVRHLNRPYTYWTSDRVVNFLKESVNTDPVELTSKLEGYCISGAKVAGRNYMQQLLDLKARTASLISRKLAEATGGRVTKMSYQAFDTITDKHGIVVQNWPLSVFQAPSKYNSRLEVDALYNAWETNGARFYQLSHDEYQAWKQGRESAHLELVCGGENAATEDNLPSPDVLIPTTPPTTTTTNGAKRKSAAINVGTDAHGAPLTITRTTKNPRKDKAHRGGHRPTTYPYGGWSTVSLDNTAVPPFNAVYGDDNNNNNSPFSGVPYHDDHGSAAFPPHNGVPYNDNSYAPAVSFIVSCTFRLSDLAPHAADHLIFPSHRYTVFCSSVAPSIYGAVPCYLGAVLHHGSVLSNGDIIQCGLLTFPHNPCAFAVGLHATAAAVVLHATAVDTSVRVAISSSFAAMYCAACTLDAYAISPAIVCLHIGSF